MSDNKTQKNGNLVPAGKSELIKYSHALVSRGLDLAKKITLESINKAAEQGVADAQNDLGFMYASGKGVQQDDAKAAKWYCKAAEQGYAKAQYNLGVAYDSGEGVMQSDEAAADWYYKAGLSYLKEGKRDDALMCVESIKDLKTPSHLTVPNAFLADKLATAIYGGKERRK